jgi:hypothetical protein
MHISPRSNRTAVPFLLILGFAIGFGGCGGSGGSTSSQSSATTTATVSANVPAKSTAAHSPASHVTAHSTQVGGNTVASVNGVPITRAELAHWLAVTAALSGSAHGASTSAVRDKALGFLITQQWVFGEAAAKGISVSEAQANKRLTEVESKQFKKSGELQKYLTRAHETETDLKTRVKLELLEAAISKQAIAGKHTNAEKQAALTSLQDAFEKKWKALTTCQKGYTMEDCKES